MLYKRTIILVFTVAFLVNLFSYEGPVENLEYFPKTTLIELGVLENCQYSEDLFDLIELLHEIYDKTEIIPVRYYTDGEDGNYYSVFSDEFMMFYELEHIPVAVINGSLIIDDPNDINAHDLYLQLLGDSFFQPSPLKIDVVSDMHSGDEITAAIDVVMHAIDHSLENASLKVIIIEDFLGAEHTNVVRSVAEKNISLQGQGAQVSEEFMFEVQDDWDTGALKIVAFVQEDYNVLQTASTYLFPDYKTRAVVTFDRDITVPDVGFYETDYFSVVNLGLNSDYVIEVVVEEAPEGWMVTYCDGSNCYFGPLNFNLDHQNYKKFAANIIPNSSGFASFYFNITSENEEPLQIPFTFEIGSSIFDKQWTDTETLFQNYPNPFYIKNDIRTVISFDSQRIPDNSDLEIFNIKGQLVRKLTINQNRNYVTWDGKDNYGKYSATGVYFYRISGESNSAMRRMIVIK